MRILKGTRLEDSVCVCVCVCVSAVATARLAIYIRLAYITGTARAIYL